MMVDRRLVRVIASALALQAPALGGAAAAQPGPQSVEARLANLGPRPGPAPGRTREAPPRAVQPGGALVTLDMEGVSLKRALDEIARQGGVRIAYSRRVVPVERLVSVRVTAVSVHVALLRVLEGTRVVPTPERNGQILLVPAGEASSAGGPPLEPTLTGIVRAAGGAPLEGVTLTVLGTRFGAQTRPDGRYTIPGVPAGSQRLRARGIGYAPKDTVVTVHAVEPTVVDFELAASATQLDALVTVGYGATTRRDLTGAVSSVRGEELQARGTPTVTLSQSLQAKAPGVQVITNSGMPGAGARVRIRGTGSINANSEPLYVIDGLPAVQGTGDTDPKSNPLMSVDPSEIESIEILKDASATAVYGARGANGVVLITTRRGQRGIHRVALQSSYGMQSISRRIDVLGGPDYMRLANEARVNAGQTALFTDAQIAAARTYDYPEMMLRGAPQESHAASLSGGDQRLAYRLSGNYTRQQGIEIGSDFERYGGGLTLDSDVSSRVRVGSTLSLTRVARNAAAVENGSLGNNANGIQGAMQFAPFTPPRDTLTGAWTRTSPTTEPVPNPVAIASELQDLNTTSRLLGSAFAELDLVPGLTLRQQVGGNMQFDRIHFFAPRTITVPGVNNIAGSGFLQSSETRDLDAQTQLTLARERLGWGRLNLMGLFQVQRFYSEAVLGRGEGFPTDETTVFNLGSGSTLLPSGSGVTESAILSYLGRANYAIRDRYLFTVSGRYDGSSRFGRNNKWAFFPSGAFAWRLSEEPFLGGLGSLSDLKLRVSYGQVGNQAVAAYQSLSALGTAWAAFGGTEVPTLAPGGTKPNPDLRWEQQTQLNVGLDVGLWNDRVTLTADAYRSRTSDLLLVVPLPGTTGFTQQWQNIGAVRNTGLELAVSSVNLVRPTFTWRTSFNIAGNRNRVLDVGAQDSLIIGARGAGFLNPGQTHMVKEGEPLGSIYGFRVVGLWQEGDACYLRVARDCTPGEYKIQDVNGDSAITAADRVILGQGDPKVFGGLTNNLTVGPFFLDAFVNFVQGNKVINAGKAYGCLAIAQVNERRCVLDRWTPDNTDTDVPRANISRPRRLYSTLVEDGSYVRLQTVTLGYLLPARLVRRVESARVFVTGQNLWLSTDYSGFDPDVNSMGGDARFGGYDVGAYPRTRTWNVGLHLTF